MKQKIVLATANQHKLQEINAIAQKFEIEFVKVDDGFDPIENGETFEENAYIKAFEAAKLTGKIAFADDTGLCVEKLDGRPGIYSARYAPTQETKISKLQSFNKLAKNSPEHPPPIIAILFFMISHP